MDGASGPVAATHKAKAKNGRRAGAGRRTHAKSSFLVGWAQVEMISRPDRVCASSC